MRLLYLLLFCFSIYLEDGQSFLEPVLRRKYFSSPSTKEQDWSWNLLNNIFIYFTSFSSLFVVTAHICKEIMSNAAAGFSVSFRHTLPAPLIVSQKVSISTDHHFLSKTRTALLMGRMKRWKPIQFCFYNFQKKKKKTFWTFEITID